MSRYLVTPVPVTVAPHPNVLGGFTHVIRQKDAQARGWLFFGDTPWGVWRSRSAAFRAARKLQAQGLVSLKGGAS